MAWGAHRTTPQPALLPEWRFPRALPGCLPPSYWRAAGGFLFQGLGSAGGGRAEAPHPWTQDPPTWLGMAGIWEVACSFSSRRCGPSVVTIPGTASATHGDGHGTVTVGW